MFDPSHFPADIAHSTDRSDVQYRINTEYFALPDDAASVGKPINEFDGYRVYRAADVRAGAAPSNAIPVYQTLPAGSLLVPTGAVFIRFAEGEDVNSRTRDIERAGYRIAEIPPYATHAAWVRAASGSVRDALLGVEKLAGLSGVENVAPQFVTQRKSR